MVAHLNPVFGIYAIPSLGVRVLQNPAMRPREVLAENLKTLMSASTTLRTFPEIISASAGQITNGTLDRIRRAESATNIDNLEPLAAVFGLEPWQMLVPGLRAESGHAGKPHVYGLPDWPFDMVDRERYLSLQEPSRAYVQAKAASAIEEREAALPKARDRTEQLAKDALLPNARSHGKGTKQRKA